MIDLTATVTHKRRISAAAILVLLLGVTLASATGLGKLIPTKPAEEHVAEAGETEQKQPEKPKITIPNLITYSIRLSEKLIDQQSQIAKIVPVTDVREQIPPIEKTLETLD